MHYLYCIKKKLAKLITDYTGPEGSESKFPLASLQHKCDIAINDTGDNARLSAALSFLLLGTQFELGDAVKQYN